MPVTLRTIATSPEPREETRPAPELFSQEQLEAHAEQLAQTQTLAPDPGRAQPLSSRLDKSAEVLEDAYHTLTSAAHSDARPVGSEDWLRDNYHVVQDQIREIRQDLPRKFYLELPKLAGRSVRGLPACLRAGPRAGDPHRRPLRSRDAHRLCRRVSARRAALDRRDLGHPDHAAARAGRGAARSGDRRRQGAPQPRVGAPVGSALRRSDRDRRRR